MSSDRAVDAVRPLRDEVLRHDRYRRRPRLRRPGAVLYGMLGLYPGKKGRFVKDFLAEAKNIEGAVHDYV